LAIIEKKWDNKKKDATWPGAYAVGWIFACKKALKNRPVVFYFVWMPGLRSSCRIRRYFDLYLRQKINISQDVWSYDSSGCAGP